LSKYTTGEIAKLCGVTVRTVQFYDNKGILVPSELTEGGRRLYSEEDLKKMKVICFLRDLDISINDIQTLLKEDNKEKVIALLLKTHEQELENEIKRQKEKLDSLQELSKTIARTSDFKLDSIGDMALIMKNKKKLTIVRRNMILIGIPLTMLEWGAVILGILKGIWRPVIPSAVLLVIGGICISNYYFKNVAYICPECGKVFAPNFKEAFFANHTPNTRKLTCPDCGKKSFCVETHVDALNNNQ